MGEVKDRKKGEDRFDEGRAEGRANIYLDTQTCGYKESERARERKPLRDYSCIQMDHLQASELLHFNLLANRPFLSPFPHFLLSHCRS